MEIIEEQFFIFNILNKKFWYLTVLVSESLITGDRESVSWCRLVDRSKQRRSPVKLLSRLAGWNAASGKYVLKFFSGLAELDCTYVVRWSLSDSSCLHRPSFACAYVRTYFLKFKESKFVPT